MEKRGNVTTKVYIILADDTTINTTVPDRSGMALHTISLGCQNEGLITRMGLREGKKERLE